MSGANPETSTPTEAQEREQEQKRRQEAERLTQRVPPTPTPTLPSLSEPSSAPLDAVRELTRIFEENLRLQVARVEQLAGLWTQAWQQVASTLQTMQDTARIMQVVIGASEDTRQGLDDAVNRLGIATTAIARVTQEQMALLQAQQQQSQ